MSLPLWMTANKRRERKKNISPHSTSNRAISPVLSVDKFSFLLHKCFLLLSIPFHLFHFFWLLLFLKKKNAIIVFVVFIYCYWTLSSAKSRFNFFFSVYWIYTPVSNGMCFSLPFVRHQQWNEIHF